MTITEREMSTFLIFLYKFFYLKIIKNTQKCLIFAVFYTQNEFNTEIC